MKTPPGVFQNARLEHPMETLGRPIASTRPGFALRFQFLWPVRFKARKAGFAFFNSLHSFTFLREAAADNYPGLPRVDLITSTVRPVNLPPGSFVV